ncbi:STAS domain-containing protein [Paenisporosarcina cavernae]|uniref:STAS domain-containing protein n=2 Tax=Paenisporosarcina cavernae TaxID=2320858 RepID=A0A385YTS7_9BACL|nr:STAS domain-containing protein [Paenisporosarcina cavernae]
MKDVILANAEQLATLITEKQNETYKELKDSTIDFLSMRIELVEMYGACMGLSEGQREELLKEWGEKSGTYTASHGDVSLDMMLREVPHYRTILGDLIFEEAEKLKLTTREFYEVISLFDRCINDVVFYFSVPFVQHEQKKLEISRQLVTELSVPVVLITNQIAVLPLIGSINEERAKVLHERALSEAARLQISYMYVDLSGVQTIDTYVAQQLFHLLDSLALLGIEGKVSGISPIIAQTLVQLGLDFGRFESFSSLKQALAELKPN